MYNIYLSLNLLKTKNNNTNNNKKANKIFS